MTERTRRHIVASLVVTLAGLTAVPADASGDRTTHVCTWGGNPGAPTGQFDLHPGITNTPSTGPLYLVATGPLSGDGPCHGNLTFDGAMRPGSSCIAQEFEGRVRGLPGVTRFWGVGALGAVHEFMYDRQGNVVGADQPQAFTTDNAPHFTECNSPEGLTHMTFSAVVELFGTATGT
jgi:hypothetical protein